MAEKKIKDRTVRYDRLPGDQGLDMLLWLAVAQFAVKTEFSGIFEDGVGSALLKGLRPAA